MKKSVAKVLHEKCLQFPTPGKRIKWENGWLMRFIALWFSFLLMAGSCSKSPVKEEFPPLFPFLISYDAPDNASSVGHLVSGPAGRDGFVRIENGRFMTNAGPIRFHATNLTGPANFPTHGQADSLAARLARFGFNCVRLHYMDSKYGNFLHELQPSIIAEDPKTQRNLDEEQMDRLDYLISVLKNRGIYVNINLHVARWWDERDGFTGKEGRPNFDKGLDNYEPRMIELQKEYAHKLLTHVNPYTKLPYTNDPCVAMVEINNENALFRSYYSGTIDKLPEPYAGELRKQWNEWLLKKYKTTNELLKVWKSDTALLGRGSNPAQTGVVDPANLIEKGTFPTLRNAGAVPAEARKDFTRFLYDTEKAYWTGIYRYLKDELKVKAPVSGTQLNYSPPQIQAELDYIDSHAYWCHPSPVNPEWKIRNEAMVNSMTNILNLAAQRVKGKPYTVSEYNHPFPNQYGAEGQPMLRAYGSLQGWDGVFEYTYNHQSDFYPVDNNYFFSIIARTDVLAHMPACAAMYLRGDVSEAKSEITTPVDFNSYFDHLAGKSKVGANISDAGFDIRQTLIRKTAVDLTGNAGTDPSVMEKPGSDQKIISSDTGELTWNTEQSGAGFFTVNTANTKLFTGFPANRKIELGDVSLSVGKTRLGWATISLVSRFAGGFGSSGKSNILVTATGVTENKDMTIEKVDEKHIRLSNWGTGPVVTEGIPATLRIPADASKTKCFALDPGGNRKLEVPVKNNGSNTSEIVLKPEYETIWYEIDIQ